LERINEREGERVMRGGGEGAIGEGWIWRGAKLRGEWGLKKIRGRREGIVKEE